MGTEVALGKRSSRNIKRADAPRSADAHNYSQSHCSSLSEQSGLWANLIMEMRHGKLADWILAQISI